MLELTNLSKLTACAFIAILSSGSLIAQPSIAGNGNSYNQYCNSNNGHGNNADIFLTLSSGRKIIVTKFDHSNPGNGGYIDERIRAANSSLSSVDFLNAQVQLQQMIHDVELHGQSSSGSFCGNSTVGNNARPSNTASQVLSVFAD